MSPRSPKATDDEVFQAVLAAVSRLGPDRATLAHVADAVGVTPGALVQRFGSKRELLLAAVRSWGAAAEAPGGAAASAGGSRLEALREHVACGAAPSSPEEVASQLAMLQLDVTDPDFRAEAARYFAVERETLRLGVEAAVAAGELTESADPHGLADALQALASGARILAPFLGAGEAAAATARALEALLGPYRA